VVDGVTAHGVAELVGQDPAQLLLVEEVDHPGVDDDDGPVQPEGHGVEAWLGLDVELRDDRCVQGGRRVVQRPLERRELTIVDPDRRPEVKEPDGALVDQAGQELDDGVEALELAQCHQGAAVCGVLPGAGADVAQDGPGTGGSGLIELRHERSMRQPPRAARLLHPRRTAAPAELVTLVRRTMTCSAL
jgi:hypothetical protein